VEKTLAGLVLALSIGGCVGSGSNLYDFDSDGSLDEIDCGPADATVFPGADDPYGDDLDQNCDGIDGIDQDGDGYPAQDLNFSPEDPEDMPLWDCVDSNADVHPGAEEIANNGLDDDCRDGPLDDLDGDGFGASDDCDDSDASSYVGAPELADGADNDCDGDVDEGTAGVDDDGDGSCEGADYEGTGILSCYDEAIPGDCDDTNMGLNQADEDGDGFTTCGDDNLASSGDEDCDDGDANRNPGVAEECDGADNDCNGEIDEGGAAPITWYADADLDGYGDSTSSVTACTQAPGYVALEGDCNDGDPAVHPGAADICDGVDTDCDGQLSINETDLDGDSFTPCEGDCDDNDASLNLDDLDSDGYTSCAADCDDNDASLNPADLDGDGYSPCAGDCDDDDSTRNPGITEICDGLDNNCDGQVPSSEIDFDTDGYRVCDGDCDDGDAGQNLDDLDNDGYTSCNGECDDSLFAVNPAAVELCDGIDNDCNGLADAGSPGTAGRESDADSDGYMLCEGDCNDNDASLNLNDGDGDAYSTCTGECDDSDGSIYPLAPEEPCDGIDSDCLADSAEVDDDGDGYLDCSGYTGSVTGILAGDDCDDGEAAVFPGNTETCDGGLDNDCDPTTPPEESIDADLDGHTLCGPDDTLGTADDDCDDTAGWVYPPVGGQPGAPELCDGVDNDCDGAIEIGSSDDDADGQTICGGDCNDGDAAVYLGATEVFDAQDNDCDGAVDENVILTPGAISAVIDGETWGDNAGEEVAGVGDVDGDGLDDILVGAPYYNAIGFDNGRAYLFLGSTLQGAAQLNVSTADATFNGVGSGDKAGRVVAAAGDVDNDGFADLLISAPDSDSCGTTQSPSCGNVYLMLGSTVAAGIQAGSPVFDLSDADLRFTGETAGDQAGWAISTAGDVDGDNLDDILIGAFGNDEVGNNGGKAYLVRGATIASQLLAGNTSFDLGFADAAFLPQNPGDYAGFAVAGVGDINNDGTDDIVIGAPHYGNTAGNFAGRAYLYLGATVRQAMVTSFGPDDLELSDADLILSADPAEDGGSLGQAVARRGNIDGDQYDDLLIAAPSAGNGSPKWHNGHSYVVLGSTVVSALGSGSGFSVAAADHTLLGVDHYENSGTSLAFAGDVDGDGGDDLLLGAPYRDAPNSNALNVGIVYLVLSDQLNGSPGSFELSGAEADLRGEASQDRAGMCVDTAGDVNNDGLWDFLIGAPWNDSSDSGAGRAYLAVSPY